MTHRLIVRAGAMLLEHIGFTELGRKVHQALEVCGQYERKVVMTGRSSGVTGKEFGDYLLSSVEDPTLNTRWQEYASKIKN